MNVLTVPAVLFGAIYVFVAAAVLITGAPVIGFWTSALGAVVWPWTAVKSIF